MSSASNKAVEKPTAKALWRKVILFQERQHCFKQIAICVDRDGVMWKVYTLVSNGAVTDLILGVGESHKKEGKARTFTADEAIEHRQSLLALGYAVNPVKK